MTILDEINIIWKFTCASRSLCPLPVTLAPDTATSLVTRVTCVGNHRIQTKVSSRSLGVDYLTRISTRLYCVHVETGITSN